MKRRVADELSRIDDQPLLARLRELPVEPYDVQREWAYDQPGETYACWTVAEHEESNMAIAYCEKGFSPSHPWGLVRIKGSHLGIGWFRTLEARSARASRGTEMIR